VWVSLSIAGEREKEIKRRNDNFHSILEPPEIDACADTALEEMQSLTEKSGIEEKQARSEIFFFDPQGDNRSWKVVDLRCSSPINPHHLIICLRG
jgi:hypothetical protein